MITELTQEQKGKLAEYKNKWIKIGLSTNNITSEETNDIISKFYSQILSSFDMPADHIPQFPYIT